MANVEKAQQGFLTADRVFLGLLLLSFPAAVASHFWFPGTNTFVFCALALVPLARLMGQATEVIAHAVGPALGGLLNASFGNAAELIIAIAGIRAGQIEVVKASLTGSILGNILLVLGAAIVAGGWKREFQTINPTAALSGSAMMFLACTALFVPDLFHLSRGDAGVPALQSISNGISVVLLVMYAGSLLFALKTHKHLYAAEGEGQEEELPSWSPKRAVVYLLLATAGVVVVAEFLVHAIEPVVAQFGLTHTFVGVIVIAIVGNAAEHSTAILVAMKNKMDLAFNIAFESSKQIAMFVAPVLVLCSGVLGHPMNLEFSHMEIVGVAAGVGAVTLIGLDGKSNWLEGVMLLGVYAVFAIGFFFMP